MGEVAKALGCKGCSYCDEKAAAQNHPCCTKPSRIEINRKTGKCLSYRVFTRA